LYVPLENLDALGRASLGADRWSALLCSHAAQVAYAFIAVAPSRVRARMFAPALGVSEDPATGGAAGPLGAYLVRHDLAERDAGGRTRIRCEQGVEMGRPSAIEIEVCGATSSPDVHVGGACVDVGGGWIDV
jgi:trans-2,3-dihydro-3-hydroxyanthranilate isomerase